MSLHPAAVLAVCHHPTQLHLPKPHSKLGLQDWHHQGCGALLQLRACPTSANCPALWLCAVLQLVLLQSGPVESKQLGFIEPPSWTPAANPCAGELLASVIETAILVPKTIPGDRTLRGRFISLFHRMVRLLLCTQNTVCTIALGPRTVRVRAAPAALLHLALHTLDEAAAFCGWVHEISIGTAALVLTVLWLPLGCLGLHARPHSIMQHTLLRFSQAGAIITSEVHAYAMSMWLHPFTAVSDKPSGSLEPIMPQPGV